MTVETTKLERTFTDIGELRAALLAGTPVSEGIEDAIPAVLLPSNMVVADLEHLLPAPTRVRRSYNTNSLDDFLTYCAEAAGLDDYGTSNPHIFYTLDEPPTARAILDFGSASHPAWSQHNAHWTPRQTPAFTALRNLFNKTLDQDTLTNYIDDWSDYLSFETADGAPIKLAAARGAFTDLNADAIKTMRSKVGDFNRERSALERVSMAPTVPARIILTCSPWDGFSAHALRVRVAADGSNLALRLSLIGWPTVQDDLCIELRERLEAIEAPITVLSGRV